MKANSKQLKKKKTFKEVYGTEIEILLILLCMVALGALAVASIYIFVFLCKKFGAIRVIIGFLIATSILCIVNFIIYCIGKRKLAYIPLTTEECEKLGIENLYDMFMFLNGFLKTKSRYSDYYDLLESQADEVLNLSRYNGHCIKIKASNSIGLYEITGYEYQNLHWLQENKEELEKITLLEANNGQ